MFKEALFMIGKNEKRPRHPSIGESKRKLVHLYNGILFSDKKIGTTKPGKDMRDS